MELALAQISITGGIGGKKLVLVTRDDNGNPVDAVRAAEELIAREKVDVLMGSFVGGAGADRLRAAESLSSRPPSR